MKRLPLLFLGLCLSYFSVAQTPRFANPEKVVGSMHDFRSSNQNANVRSQSSSQVCVFCHTPHYSNPSTPLWNHKLSSATEQKTYTSSTLVSSVGLPQDGDSSKLCLGCHDGTVALGDTVNNGTILFQNTSPEGKLLSTRSNLGIEASDDHPSAFLPDTGLNKQIKMPPAADSVRLDPKGRVQCTSCHNAHDEDIDKTEGRFLAKNNSGAAICTTCHDLKGSGDGAVNQWSWSGLQGLVSSHQSAVNVYDVDTNYGGINWLGSHTGYATVSSNACEACHRAHTAHDAAQLLKGQTDQVCFQCHDGNKRTGLPNLPDQFRKRYVHPSTGPQLGHDPAETPNTITSRHAACDDCHNPHAVSKASSVVSPPALSSALYGQSGITANGTVRDPRRGTGDAQYEYEICFKCHGDSPSKPQRLGEDSGYGRNAKRQYDVGVSNGFNTRYEFSDKSQIVSAHPVVQPSLTTRAELPSLREYMLTGDGNENRSRAPLSKGGITGQIYCTDCHNNDTGKNLSVSSGVSVGADPSGPHSSNNEHLLERKQLMEPIPFNAQTLNGIPYSPDNNALCTKCHDLNILFGNTDPFRASLGPGASLHAIHVQNQRAACSTCHDPHASASPRLMNFDLQLVSTPPSFVWKGASWTGYGKGTCNLTCHGANHSNTPYPTPPEYWGGAGVLLKTQRNPITVGLSASQK